MGQLLEAGDEEIAQPEELELLGRLGAGADIADIIELAPLRRAPAANEIGQGVEARFAPDGRHEAERQEQDQPGRIDKEARAKRHHGDHVLRLAEHLAEERIAARCLASRALEPVLVLGRFEMHEVEPRRMRHQLDADLVGVEFRQHGIHQSGRPRQEVRTDHQCQFDGQQHQYGR